MNHHYKSTPFTTHVLDNQENGRLMVKLWEHFSTAAAGVCQLYRETLDRSSDFGCLVDALRPLDSFFKGSLHSFDVALCMGRVAGARRRRLDIRDLAQDNVMETYNVTESNGRQYEVYVPLGVFLSSQQLGESTGRSLLSDAAFHVGTKRHHTIDDFHGLSYARRCKRRSLTSHHCRRCSRRKSCRSSHLRNGFVSVANEFQHPLIYPSSPSPDSSSPEAAKFNITNDAETNESSTTVSYFETASVIDDCANMPIEAAPILRVAPITASTIYRSLLGRRTWLTSHHHTPITTSASDTVLQDCLVSSTANRSRSAVYRDRFQAFCNAVHVANLLDPLSKFCVTSQADTEPASPHKRPRREPLIVPTGSPDRSQLNARP